MKRTKKMLSVFLSLVLALAMVPSIAFADEAPEATKPIVKTESTQQAGADLGKKARTSTEEVYVVASIVSNGYVYTGKAIKPAVTVYVEETGEVLTKGVDYTVSYFNNVSKGVATIEVAFIGSWEAETIELEFIIGNWINMDGEYGFGFEYEGDLYGFVNEFAVIGGKTYCFDENGYRMTGWWDINGKRYRFNANGVMQKGLILVNGGRYYMNPENGQLRTGLWTISGNTYYFNPSSKSYKGKAYSGWKTLNGKTYYFNGNNKNIANKNGIWKVGGKKYYFNKCVRQTGWKTVGGKKYYFRPGSSPKGQAYSTAGVRTIGGKKYYFYAAGNCALNKWVKGHYYNSLGQQTK